MVRVDIEMPKSCDDCYILVWGPFSDVEPYCKITGKKCGELQMRPLWCPLSEIEDDTDDRR